MADSCKQLDDHTRLLRALHAAGRKRGYGHASLREIVGVESLSDATEKQLRAALARLGTRNQGPGSGKNSPHRRGARRASAPGTIRLPSEKQRNLVQKLIYKLCWLYAELTQYIGGTWRTDDLGRWWKDEDRTSADASKTINVLIGYTKTKNVGRASARQCTCN